MSSTAVAPREPKNEQEILATYRQMQSEMQGLIQNLTKIEMDRNEHRYVTIKHQTSHWMYFCTRAIGRSFSLGWRRGMCVSIFYRLEILVLDMDEKILVLDMDEMLTVSSPNLDF